jgi:hypothetical protein
MDSVEGGLDGSRTMGANFVRVGGCCGFVQVDALTVAATAAAAAAIVVVASQQGSVGAGRGWSFEGYYTVLVSFAPVLNSKTVTAVCEPRDRNPSDPYTLHANGGLALGNLEGR